MEEREGRYINPYTDYGFKYLFGTEPNKEFTLALVNELLRGKEVIKSLTLIPSEQLAFTQDQRRYLFKVYCENEQGENIIIEIQKAEQTFFKDRAAYYSSFPISQQVLTGDLKFNLKAFYTIGILDFVFDEDEDDEEYYHHSLNNIYLEMPKFNKTEDELESLFDKWLYALKNLPQLLERPAALQERIFKKFFDVAQTANLSKEEYAKYMESEKIYHDLDGAFRTASQKGYTRGVKKGLAEGLTKGRAEGLEKGRAEGQQEEKEKTVRRLKKMGLTVEQIAEGTSMTIEEVTSILP